MSKADMVLKSVETTSNDIKSFKKKHPGWAAWFSLIYRIGLCCVIYYAEDKISDALYKAKKAKRAKAESEE
jgi:hypothetical protein